MSLSATRQKRCNAGNRMGKLLEAEDEDDFYKTTYGGFDEEAEDNDYASEASDSDNADTDFSIDEDDEVRSDHEEDAPKRKTGISTKAYKEPKKPKVKTDKATKPADPKPSKSREASTAEFTESFEKKSLRQSTLAKAKAADDRKERDEARMKMMKEMAARKNVSEVRRLTQQELLEEAKVTEKINLRALATYQRMELEKKKSRVRKICYTGPIIRYHSVTMPLIEHLPVETEINVDGETPGDVAPSQTTVLTPSEKCSRTFVTFTDDAAFRATFPPRPARTVARPVAGGSSRPMCPVTHLPAKYRDPVTLTPYASAEAFRRIRAEYVEHVKAETKRLAVTTGVGVRRTESSVTV